MDFDEEQPIASSSRVTLDSSPVAISSASTGRVDAQSETTVVENVRSLSPQSPGAKGKRKDLLGEGSTHDDDEMSETEDEEDHAHCTSPSTLSSTSLMADELERQRRIRENQILIDSLGLQPTSTPRQSSFSMNTPTQSSAKRKRRETHKEVFDRSGYIISLPALGERRQRMACVEMPSDRQLRKRIADGEYADCEHWWEGEERRWRFGHGHGENIEGEDEEYGGVNKDFRWRKWRGLEKELRAEMRQRGEMNSRDKAGNQQSTLSASEPTPYSGDPCHQCRRKSDKPKMKCRNINPVCRAVFCETCCRRYSYFDFDTESRSFICPLCKDCCNCANCIRKRDLHHLLGPGRVGAKSKDQLESGMTVQAWLEKATQEKRGIPFERVRLVDHETDIISPDLPPETPPVTAKTVKSRKRKAKEPKHVKAKKPRKLSKQDGEEDNAAGKENGLRIKIKITVPPRPARVKEVDSEGDTVGGYSDDDAESVASSQLTSLSDPASRSSTISLQPDLATNDYLASLVPAKTIDEAMSPPERTMPTLAAPMSQLTEATGDSRGRPPTSSISSQESVLDSGKKRRKPPPKANILRAPKYTTQVDSSPTRVGPETSSQPELDTPLTADVSQTWQDNTTSMQFQSFSFEGYSSLPPASEVSAMPMSISVPQMPSADFMMHGYPPPYSHSPPPRQAALDVQSMAPYAGVAMLPHMPSVQPQVFARTGLRPSVRALHPAAVGSIDVPGAIPGYNPKHVYHEPVGIRRIPSADVEVNFPNHGGFWREQNMLDTVGSRPRSGPEMENGLMLNRRYFPGHP